MRLIDIIGFILSILGAYSALLYLRFLLPRNFIPIVSLLVNDTSALLNNAEALGAIQHGSEYRMSFEILRNLFLRMRTTSHRSTLFYQQFQLAFLSTLTYRLYFLHSRIDAIRLEVERLIDEHQLASTTAAQTAASTALPTPAAITATPNANIAEPTPPPPAVVP